jgi:branched-chain amino acid transport system substrate-binding protein
MNTIHAISSCSTPRGILLLSLLLVAGCRGIGGAGAPGVARVAIVFDDAMGQASLGSEAKRGALIAVEEAGSSAPSTAFFGDAGAAEAAQGSLVTVGFTDSDELRAALPAFAAAGTSLLVAGATDPCVVRAPGGDLLRFACYSDPMQGAAMAEFAHARLGVRKVAVLFDAGSEFASAVGSAFVSVMRGLPDGQARVTAYSGDFAPSIDAVLSSTPSGAPDAVYLAALPRDAPRVIRALRSRGFTGPVLGPDSFDEAEILTASDLGTVLFSTHAWLAAQGEPATESFVRRYRSRFGAEPTAFAALGYDATRIAMDAVRRAEAAGVLNRASVARALDEVMPHEGLSGRIAPAPGARFPVKPVWIVEAGAGMRRLAARWEPVAVPDPVCGKAP